MTRLLCLPWLVCRSVSYYTNLHDWVIKLFQTRWQKCPAFRTSKKCGRADFPLWLCTAHEKSLAASMLTLGGGSSTKKVPQAPESRQLHRLHQGVFVWTAWTHCGAFASFPKKLTTARQLPSRGNEHARNWLSRYSARLQVVPHFSSGIVERAKCKRVKITPRDKRQHLTGRGKNEGPSFFSLPVGCYLFLHGMIFMRAYVLLALLSLSKSKGLYS